MPERSSPTRPRDPGARNRRADAITAHLLERIGARVLRPGDELPSESDLALRFNVSKPVVREALNSLAARSLIEIRQGRPTRVLELSSAPLSDFFAIAIRASEHGLREALELRRALETETAALAAERATPVHIASLEEVLQHMRRNIGRLDAWLDGDFAFHMMLVRCADNALMLYLTEAIGDVMKQSMRLLGQQTDLRKPKETLARHEAIFNAVRSHDPQAARQAMQMHFEATQPVVLAIARDRSRLSGVPIATAKEKDAPVAARRKAGASARRRSGAGA